MHSYKYSTGGTLPSCRRSSAGPRGLTWALARHADEGNAVSSLMRLHSLRLFSWL